MNLRNTLKGKTLHLRYILYSILSIARDIVSVEGNNELLFEGIHGLPVTFIKQIIEAIHERKRFRASAFAHGF